MKTRYITIEREYGSGGTKIARLLSEKTGVPCYGREILEAVSKKHGISVDKIEKYEESATGSFLFSLYALSRTHSGDPEMLTDEGRIFVAEQQEIGSLAARGSGIFLGHCASEAFKETDNVVKVFIRGSVNDKKQRVIHDYNIPEAFAEATMRSFDRKRSNYYYANTLKHWNDLSNYDTVLDSSVLGIDNCVEMLRVLL